MGMKEKMRTAMRFAAETLSAPPPLINTTITGKRSMTMIKLEKITIRDAAFIANMAALLFVTSAVAMPLMTITLFGLRNMVTAIFYAFFATVINIRVHKPGAITLLGVFYGAILLMMSPVMCVTNIVSACFAEVISLALFRSYENTKGMFLAPALIAPLTLPFTAVFSVIMNDVAFSDVVQSSYLVPLAIFGTVLLSFAGVFLGWKIGSELKKAGRL
jgi:hypothetical protein